MSNGIDATVVLGLATKVSQVFDEPNTYLSFPLFPIPMERARLRALVQDPLGPVGQQALAAFALLVNEPADGPLWQPNGDQRLWDVYGDVLAGADLAEGTRTAEEEADFQRAYELLYHTEADGAVVESATTVAYEQYRDAYLSAAQEYNNRKGEATIRTDPVVLQQWAADEPVLREQLTRAEQNWAIAGHRAEVDDARRLLRDLGSRSPLMVWAGYRKLYDPDLPEVFFRTAADNSMYLPTSYAPADVVDAVWPTITMTRTEFSKLAASAPEGIRSRLSTSASDAAIDSVAFEYSSITVLRPWFAPEVFGSRSWRFYDHGRVLSDGGTPPTGECTAYVSGLVLARNISVRRQATGRSVTGPGFLPAAGATNSAPLARPYLETALLRRVEARRVAVARAATLRAASAATQPTPRAAEFPQTLDASSKPIVRDSHVIHPVRRVPRIRPIVRIPGVRLPFVIRPRPLPQATDKTTTTDPSEVYVLAFICRRLPKSPNPDPALTW